MEGQSERPAEHGLQCGVHHLLREPHRLGPVHVWAHVHVLRLRHRAVARRGRRPVSAVPGGHPGRHPHLHHVGGTVFPSQAQPVLKSKVIASAEIIHYFGETGILCSQIEFIQSYMVKEAKLSHLFISLPSTNIYMFNFFVML